MLWMNIKKSKYIYLLLVPILAYYLVFKYIPIYGLQLAFKEFSLMKGIAGSDWVGLAHFRSLFVESDFWQAFFNTIIISFMKLVIGFPIPVFIAILLNEIFFERFKRVLQVIYTFPHFLSWVILSSLIFNMLSSHGAVNNILALFGAEKINFLTNIRTFRYLLVFSEMWKEFGWGTIVYMATITCIDPSLYEASKIDGANRLQRNIHIVWPGIKSVVVTMLILNVGHLMSAGFMQIFNLYNPAVYSVADILDTYVYRISFLRMPNFGFSTAVGLFTGITNCILLLSANFVAKKLGEKGIV